MFNWLSDLLVIKHFLVLQKLMGLQIFAVRSNIVIGVMKPILRLVGNELSCPFENLKTLLRTFDMSGTCT